MCGNDLSCHAFFNLRENSERSEFEMEFALISLLTTIGGIILYLIMGAAVKAPGSLLQAKFAQLGTLTNYTYSQIFAKCGNPSSVSSTVDKDGNKITIRQWISTGYHIVLLFDENDNCLGISSETKV